jgi:large subunit ribosomal protein L23
VQEIFNVKVKDVRTMNLPDKPKRYGRYTGMSGGYKRAIVTLEAGQSIELFEEI